VWQAIELDPDRVASAIGLDTIESDVSGLESDLHDVCFKLRFEPALDAYYFC
jgi:hypothetical protein